MMLITTILLNVLDMPFAFLTIFGVVRNQYFYLGEAVLTEIPAAVNFVVATFVIVEMAEGGDEGIVYGLLTTTYNLGSPFAQAISNQIFGLFTPRLSDSANYLEDTHSFRRTAHSSRVGYLSSRRRDVKERSFSFEEPHLSLSLSLSLIERDAPTRTVFDPGHTDPRSSVRVSRLRALSRDLEV